MPSIPQRPEFIHTAYTSDDVLIPASFLTTPPPDAKPITITPIDFTATPLPEYAGSLAVILDNVLSPSECAHLVRLAEASAQTSRGWQPALVNAGPNVEVLATDYRNSDRIIWDSSDLTERLWKRCCAAPGLAEMVGKVSADSQTKGPPAVPEGQSWTFTRLNERMRFLRYGPGQFFQRHCDGSYVNEAAAPRTERSLLTLQLYLTSDEGLSGGATSFHSRRRPAAAATAADSDVHVRAKLGRVLLFQHRGLLHSGQEVERGVKIAMRTDLMYLLDE